MTRQTHSAKQTQQEAKTVLAQLEGSNVIFLVGQMGAGKTTLAQGLAEELGVKAKIISPTFVLIRRYDLTHPQFTTLWHVDLYRLEGEDQIKTLGLEEIWQDKRNLVVIEWPEKLGKLVPEHKIEVAIERLSENKRTIEIS